MASRKDQIARRREERRAREAAEKAAAQRARRMWIAGATLLGAVVLAAALVALLTSSTRKSSTASGTGFASAAIPAAKTTDLASAVRTAGCQLHSYPNYGQQHTTGPVSYRTNPPTSGAHNPTPAPDGAYPASSTPAVAQTVHSLEHGRVEIQWRPGLPAREINQLHTLFDERNGYHALLFANQTGMPYPVAATAWQHALTCPHFNPGVFDAIRDFRAAYTDKAPEFVP